ncbi:hypothetical protein GLE_4716 [Lysobacter enzymogenes]|uniref:Uncharacterized protein n=1 Tax=Lysobacter enzymogenes TaxID=69 RepID=A0A0S2DNV4_LYSEN|nr:hypothetical protein GLE_4716 [Lysobacter enzymogenes]
MPRAVRAAPRPSWPVAGPSLDGGDRTLHQAVFAFRYDAVRFFRGPSARHNERPRTAGPRTGERAAAPVAPIPPCRPPPTA